LNLNEGHKKAIVQMFAHGTSIRELAEWYKVDQGTIRELLRPHIKFAVETGRGFNATKLSR
jgi:hypothetical protein